MSDTPLIHDDRDYVRGRELGRGETNDRAASCVECTVTCEDYWSLAQLQALGLLSKDGRLLERVLPRAKRTAGHYAALFLGDEGKPAQGRFYWAGLAAFAAKQVVEGIEYADKNLDSFVGQVRAMAGLSLYYLLKGNFWVFVEVVPWMVFYRDRGHALFVHCVDRRDVNSYSPSASETTKRLPWAIGENVALKRSIEKRLRSLNLADLSWSKLNLADGRGALAEVSNCKSTSHLKDGFNELRAYEELQPSDRTASRQRGMRAHAAAWSFLRHEQELHLQAMIYDHEDFQYAWDNNDLGRKVNGYLPITGARDPNLVFNAAPDITPDIEQDQLRPVGLKEEQVSVRMRLDDGKLYDATERMKYVKRILNQYHELMDTHRAYMIQQLRTIEVWKDAV